MLNTVGQSPLGAFIQTALGARTIASGGQVVILAVTADEELFVLDPACGVLMGPLDLDTTSGNCTGLDCDDAAEIYFLNFNRNEIAAFDSEGEELWSEAPGAGESFGDGVGFDGTYVYNTLIHETTNANDTLSIQVRNAATGAVVLTEEAYSDTTTPFGLSSYGIAVRKNSSNVWQVFILVVEDLASSNENMLLKAFDVGEDEGSPTLTETESRLLHSNYDPGNDDHHTYLARGPEFVYSCLLDVSAFELSVLDAYDPSDLSDSDSDDYTIQNSGSFFPPAVTAEAPGDTSPLFFYEGEGGGTRRVKKYNAGGTFQAQSEQMPSAPAYVQSRVITKSDAIAITAVEDAVVDTSAYSEQLFATGSPDAWILQVAPSGATVSGTGLVQWASPVKAGSPHQFRAYARGASGWDIEEWSLTVLDTAPVIQAIADDSVAPDGAYSVTPTLTSGDAPITWSLDASPSGASIDPDTGEITWTAPASPGTHDWTVRATNILGFDTESWTTTVEEVAPVLFPVADASVNQDPYNQFVIATQGEGITWTFDAVPSGMVFSVEESTFCVVTWASPTVGVHTITVRGTNGAGFDTETWQLTVT